MRWINSTIRQITYFSNDSDITGENLEIGKIVWSIKVSLSVDNGLKAWIVKEKVDVDSLLIKLMRNFYEMVNVFSKKVAL